MTTALAYRSCSCGSCCAQAQYIGTYTKPNGERCTLAACSIQCVAALADDPASQDRQVTWADRLQPQLAAVA